MDNQKDNLISSENSSIGAFVGNNQSLVFILKKAEKLSGALYIVAGFIPKEEPLADSLKRHAIELLSFTTKSVLCHNQLNSESVRFLKEVVVEILSLIEVASMSGFVSVMNKNVIVSEFNNLIFTIDREIQKTNSSISKNILDVGVSNLSFTKNETLNVADSHSFYKGQGKVTYGKKEPYKNFSYSTNRTKNTDKRHSRKDEIVALFKKEKKFMSVKDVNVFFKDYSDKTIQRELVGLVSEGVLRKEGERRWSKYALNN